MTFNLIIKEPKLKLRKSIRLPATHNARIEWGSVLEGVETEFHVQRKDIKLSLNHGKTFIEADPGTNVSDLLIVSGDILTLNITTSDTNDDIPAKVPCTSQQPRNTSPTKGLSISAEHQTALCATGHQTALCATGHQTALCATEHKADDQQYSVEEPNPMEERGNTEELRRVNHYLRSPILLRDVGSNGLLPESFHQLLDDNKTTTLTDMVVLALHTLLLESGFILIREPSVKNGVLEEVHVSPDLYRLSYTHVFHSESRVIVACVSMANQLVVHGVVQSTGNLSLVIPTKTYVNQGRLVRLAELSRHFKDGFVAPLIIAAKEALNVEALPPLLGLPYEMLLTVLDKLDYKSICRLSTTCSQLTRVCRNNITWKRLFIQLFGFSSLPKGTLPKDMMVDDYWYNLHKNYVREGRRQRLRRPIAFIPFQDPPFHPFRRPLPNFPYPVQDDPANRGIRHPVFSDLHRSTAVDPHSIPPRSNRSIINPITGRAFPRVSSSTRWL